eukprot:CAMPEP_0171559996 /NCGR_PEP_ID=MMETSP0960-20121227/13256_1 /TAXON_ID=87120 /ORGANISM="Aurantiochytrium limacinum, Strain ATCCMYA-1381" /LENGTH=70 /DNA_ID=CAMNT_0012111757 /DNA_START=381 /DNA_END=590 /DNA_ORIENTATION=+
MPLAVRISRSATSLHFFWGGLKTLGVASLSWVEPHSLHGFGVRFSRQMINLHHWRRKLGFVDERLAEGSQ